MMIRGAVCAGVALVTSLVSGPPPASAQDVNAMAKWTAATIVHYKIVGEFKGKTTILKGKNLSGDAEVSDRVEIEVDWDQMEYKLVRPPVIRNTPTVVGAIVARRFADVPGQCPLPRVDSPPEYITVTAVTAMSSILMMEQTRKLAGGALPGITESANARCGDVWDPAAPATSTLKEGLTLPPAMAIVMPAMAGMKATPDGKSLVIQTKGWTWTYTPTIVK